MFTLAAWSTASHAAVGSGSAALAAVAASSAPPASSLLPARVMKAAHDRVAAGEYPMLVIGVVNDGKSRLYGFNAEGEPAPDVKTVFEVGSITKAFTGLALAQDVKSGKLRLDEPVAKLLPHFKLPSRDGKDITLGNLAEQRSGLPRLPTNLKPANPANPYADYGAKKLKAFLANYTLPRAPGSAYEYSNLGYGLLGYALAQHAGVSYGALIKKQILDPLHMKLCGVKLDDKMRTHLAKGHGDTGKATSNWKFAALAGAGAIKCSAGDMLRYLKANMGRLKTPLHPAMELAQKPRASGPDRNKVGLGWMALDTGHGKVVWHNGMTGGYASFIGFTADGKRGVLVLTNIEQSVDDLGLATLVKSASLAPVQTTIHMSPAELDGYVGYYQLAPRFLLTVFRDDDQLYAQATGQGAFPIYPSAKDEFFAKVSDISISFLRGNKKKVVGLNLHQHGSTLAKRVDAAQAAETIGKTLVPLKASVLRNYVGRYKFKSGDVLDVSRKGDRLYAQLNGQPSIRIYPSAKDEFFYIGVNATLSFKRDKHGKVAALILHQHGANQRASKIK
jgi:CubicO group peptidase (beta-lactamase class C family)